MECSSYIPNIPIEIIIDKIIPYSNINTLINAQKVCTLWKSQIENRHHLLWESMCKKEFCEDDILSAKEHCLSKNKENWKTISIICNRWNYLNKAKVRYITIGEYDKNIIYTFKRMESLYVISNDHSTELYNSKYKLAFSLESIVSSEELSLIYNQFLKRYYLLYSSNFSELCLLDTNNEMEILEDNILRFCYSHVNNLVSVLSTNSYLKIFRLTFDGNSTKAVTQILAEAILDNNIYLVLYFWNQTAWVWSESDSRVIQFSVNGQLTSRTSNIQPNIYAKNIFKNGIFANFNRKYISISKDEATFSAHITTVITCLFIHGQLLYVGTADGILLIYHLNSSSFSKEFEPKFLRQIDIDIHQPIVHINVYETLNYHQILITTKAKMSKNSKAVAIKFYY